jgi:hypothetical protein
MKRKRRIAKALINLTRAVAYCASIASLSAGAIKLLTLSAWYKASAIVLIGVLVWITIRAVIFVREHIARSPEDIYTGGIKR